MNIKKKIVLMVMATALVVVIISAAIPVSAAYTYNRQNAVNYALDNWNTDVPGSSYFNPYDCTNFVSNCLKAGGWPETYEPWTYWQHLCFRANPYAWYSVPWANWYSYTWGGADNFGDFVSIYSGRGYPRSLAHHPWDQYFETGDIVQIDYEQDGIWDHTMIITGINDDEMYMTYHSSNTLNKPLTQIIGETEDEYPNAIFMGYRLYDSF